MNKLRLSLALLCLAGSAFAQDIDSAKLALAREVVAVMHVDKMFDAMTGQLKQMSSQAALAALPPEATEEQRQKLATFQEKMMDVTMDSVRGLIGKMDQIYAHVFSESELKAMKSFYETTDGQAILAKQPQIMQQMMPFMQEMQRDLLPKIQRMTEEFAQEMKLSEAAKP